MKKQRDLEATQEEQAKELEKVLPRGLYVDSSKPPQGQELIICDNKKLSIQETARLEFGRQLIGGIAETIQLRAAKSLPPSDGYENNAFFGLVAIHALSHIKVSFLFSSLPLPLSPTPARSPPGVLGEIFDEESTQQFHEPAPLAQKIMKRTKI
jgi:hypothetical protein